MGVWSHEPFGNDTANDWAYGLEGKQDLSWIDDAFVTLINAGDDYIDADIGCEAHAAVEVLAKILGEGTQSDTYTEKVENWIADIAIVPDRNLIEKGLQIIDLIIRDNSELKELWQEAEEDYILWLQNLDMLKNILIIHLPSY